MYAFTGKLEHTVQERGIIGKGTLLKDIISSKLLCIFVTLFYAFLVSYGLYQNGGGRSPCRRKSR